MKRFIAITASLICCMGNKMPAQAFDSHTHSSNGYKCTTAFLTGYSYTDCHKVTPESVAEEARIRKCHANVLAKHGVNDDVWEWAAVSSDPNHPQYKSYKQDQTACL